MGGLLILGGILFFHVYVGGDLNNRYLWIVIFLIFSFGVLGFLDDYLKLKYDSSDYFSAKMKIFGKYYLPL